MKDTFYFSHDSNAREDPKIVRMRSVYGWEGYGWYWMIIEMMRDQQDYRLSIEGKYAYNAFALQMHCTDEKAQQFINDCINEFKLFESDGTNIWSKSLLRRMEIKEKRSQKAKEAAKTRWSKYSDTNAMQTHSESNANKVKESKLKENSNPLLFPQGDQSEQPDETADKPRPPFKSKKQEQLFDQFWDKYPKKHSKGAAEKAWLRISPDDLLFKKILNGIENGRASPKWKKNAGEFIPNPATWLNAKGWEDEYSPPSPEGKENGNGYPKNW